MFTSELSFPYKLINRVAQKEMQSCTNIYEWECENTPSSVSPIKWVLASWPCWALKRKYNMNYLVADLGCHTCNTQSFLWSSLWFHDYWLYSKFVGERRVYCITIPSLQTFLPISNVLHHSQKFRGLNTYTHCCLKFSSIIIAKQCTVLNSKTGCTDVAIWVLIIREYGIYCYTPVGKLECIAAWESSSLVSYSSTMLCLRWYTCTIFYMSNFWCSTVAKGKPLQWTTDTLAVN